MVFLEGIENCETCDFCGEEYTDFRCWWCRRYICENCEFERIIIKNHTIGMWTRSCKTCNEARDKYDDELKVLENKYYEDRRELEENFLNSNLELNPKYKGTNTEWRSLSRRG